MTSEEDQSSVQTFRLIAEGYFLVLIGLFGVIGNMCLISWFAKKTKNFHHLMLALSCYDTLYILANVIIFGLPNIFSSLEKTSLYKQAVPILLPVAQIGMTGSIYLTVAITIERYFTVCHPYFMFSKSWPSNIYILPIVLFSVLYNLPKFLEFQVITEVHTPGFSNLTSLSTSTSPPADPDPGPSDNNNVTENIYNGSLEVVEKIDPTSLRLDPLYIKVYLIYMNFIIHGIIPFITLILLNINIYKKVRQFQLSQDSCSRGSVQQWEIRLTQISIAIFVVFILCHAVKWVPNIWEWAQTGDNPSQLEWPSWLSYVTCTSHLLTTFNCSVNFYIYFLKHRRQTEVASNIIDLPTMWTSTAVTPLENSISMTEIGNVGLKPGIRDGFRDQTVYKC